MIDVKLTHWRCSEPNFGDELSPWLWPRLLPGMFDDDANVLFLGVGSLISASLDGPARKIVMGSGYERSYAGPPPARRQEWSFRFVRGPHTARALGLDPALAVGDAAILIREVRPQASGKGDVAFMPHWESLGRGEWAAACARAGVRLIDPRWSVDRVLAAMEDCRHLLCEAMHGAVVADALRIPWTAMRPVHPRHRRKWADWAAPIAAPLAFAPLPVSSPGEMTAVLTVQGRGARRVNALTSHPAMRRLRGAMISRAALSLRCAAENPGRLSPQGSLDRARRAMGRIVEDFARTGA